MTVFAKHPAHGIRLALSQWIVVAIAISMVGCAKPAERWKAWRVDWDKQLAEADKRTVKNPDRYKPTNRDPKAALPDLDGDGPLKLSVEQVVMLAMSRNRDLAVEQLNPVIAGTYERIERGVFDPELFADFEYSKENASETARATNTRFNVVGDEVGGGVGVRQRLPSGTTVEGTIEQDRNSSSRAPEQQEARVGLRVTQSLLRGFGPAVSLARIRQARTEAAASRYELRAFAEALLADVETAYWRYVLASEQISILESALTVAKQQVEEIGKQVRVGSLAEIETAAAEAEVALREQALIDGRSELEAQRLRLMRLMNAGTAGSLQREVVAVSPSRVESKAIDDADDRVQLAQQNRPDLNEARVRLRERRLETIVTRNGVLPRLDVFIALGKTGFASTFPKSFKELDGPTYDASVGVTFSQTLGNRAARARDAAALATRRQAAAAVENLRQLIRLDVRLAINELERARQQITATRTSRVLQEKATAAEKKRFDAGAVTSLDLARSQRDLLQTQIAEIEAVIRYRIALVNLYLAEGSLLDRRGVVLAKD